MHQWRCNVNKLIGSISRNKSCPATSGYGIKWWLIVFFSVAMADQNYNSAESAAVNASPAGDMDAKNAEKSASGPLTDSCNADKNSENVGAEDKSVSCKDQSTQANCDADRIKEASVKTATGSRNGVSDVCSNKPSLFFRPSPLSAGASSSFGGNHPDSSSSSSSSSTTTESPPPAKCPLKSPKLNLAPSKLTNVDGSSVQSPVVKLPFHQSKNPFSNAVSFDNDKNESASTNSNVEQSDVNASGSPATEKLSKATFSNFSSKPLSSFNKGNSAITVPNFVFGQNLHERVADGVTTVHNATSKNNAEAANGNGMSDMLFTSVLTSKEIAKENASIDSTGSTKEPSSLIEDAARCQEARANKRKYEQVLVTTGEEDEENILQVNVKLFAFDSGTWVERGRGILRLNDKNCDGTIVSRIVIRTLGSLRVVLNTKIWSGMSLNKASERSIRLTAMDPNGQLKIFLIQASPKDMGTLFRYLYIRLKRCQENQGECEQKKEEGPSESGQETKT